MAEEKGFFNDDNKDREYLDVAMARALEILKPDGAKSGVKYGYYNELEVSLISGLDLQVDTGAAMLGTPAGWWYYNNSAKTVAADPEVAGYNRIDLMCIEVDRSTAVRTTVAKLIKGTRTTGTPVAPTLTQDVTVYQLPIASISISGSSINSVTDLRGTDDCPFINQPPKISSTLTVTTDDSFIGETVTVTQGTFTVSATVPSSKTVDLELEGLGDFTISNSYNTDTQTVTVVYYGQYNIELVAYDYFYGYDLDISDTNPATRVSYPSDVDNTNFNPVNMDFSTSIFSYGGWPSTPGEKILPKSCMLKYDGTVDYYLDEDDHSKKEDGVTASQVADTSFGGNAMMEWNKIYTKRWVENGVYKFRCCDIAIDDDYECWCNYDKFNNEIDHFYTPKYLGSSISGKLRSISGQTNYVVGTASNEITLATANGTDWYTEVLADRLLINDLLIMMGKSTNTQDVYGYGRCKDTNTAAIGQGTMNTKGMFWGDDDQTSGVKVFGMENYWGNLWRRTAGWMLVNGTQKMKLTRGTKDGSTVSEYNTTGSGYIDISGATPIGTSGGYISDEKTEEFGRVPYQVSGSSTTDEADGLWFNNADTRYAVVGGSWGDGLLVGAFCAGLAFAASFVHAYFGAALSCKPLAI